MLHLSLVIIMPVYYVCKSCNLMIYKFRVGQDFFGLPTPSELRARITVKCPRCGRELGVPSVNDILILKRGRVKVVKK